MGAWSLGIWSMGVWGYRCFGYGCLCIWSMGVWGVLGMGACVSHADICQGMHMVNSVYVPQVLYSCPMHWSKGTRVASFFLHYGSLWWSIVLHYQCCDDHLASRLYMVEEPTQINVYSHTITFRWLCRWVLIFKCVPGPECPYLEILASWLRSETAPPVQGACSLCWSSCSQSWQVKGQLLVPVEWKMRV